MHITIRPLRLTPGGKQRYAAFSEGRLLCEATEPFFAAARVLISEGVKPSTVLTMSHEGSSVVSLHGPIGKAAKLTVIENENEGPRLARHRPFLSVPGQPGRQSPVSVMDDTGEHQTGVYERSNVAAFA